MRIGAAGSTSRATCCSQRSSSVQVAWLSCWPTCGSPEGTGPGASTSSRLARAHMSRSGLDALVSCRPTCRGRVSTPSSRACAASSRRVYPRTSLCAPNRLPAPTRAYLSAPAVAHPRPHAPTCSLFAHLCPLRLPTPACACLRNLSKPELHARTRAYPRLPAGGDAREIRKGWLGTPDSRCRNLEIRCNQSRFLSQRGGEFLSELPWNPSELAADGRGNAQVPPAPRLPVRLRRGSPRGPSPRLHPGRGGGGRGDGGRGAPPDSRSPLQRGPPLADSALGPTLLPSQQLWVLLPRLDLPVVNV